MTALLGRLAEQGKGRGRELSGSAAASGMPGKATLCFLQEEKDNCSRQPSKTVVVYLTEDSEFHDAQVSLFFF